MNYKEIEEFFSSEENMIELLTKYQDCFDRIEYYQGLFREGAIDNADEIDRAMKELTGIFMSLNVVAMVADTEKTNRETRYINSRKIEIENAGKKVVKSELALEASEKVANYRRIRNIFQTYRDDCDKAISVCQSSLKGMQKERKVDLDS